MKGMGMFDVIMWPSGFAAYPQYDNERHCVSFWHYGRVFNQPTFGM
jgi:hypothetical protein